MVTVVLQFACVCVFRACVCLCVTSARERFHPVLNILDDIDELDEAYRALPVDARVDASSACDEDDDIEDSPGAGFLKCAAILSQVGG